MTDFYDTLTFRLFARPSFLEGVGRLLDTSASFQTYNYSKNGAEADYDAIASDWHMVGEDIRSAIAAYDKAEQKK